MSVWLNIYLSDRQQCATVGNVTSECPSITKGVGPLLFTIYIKDIVFSLQACIVHLYADYPILYHWVDSRKSATENM